MQRIKAFILLFVFLYLVWMLLTDFHSRQEWMVGGVVSLLLAMIFAARAQAVGNIHLNPKALVYGVGYIFVFIWELIRSNLDVARRVVSPSLPINPGIVRVRTRLQSPMGRTFLANSITLTPGTLTVESRGDILYIHWIDVSAGDMDAHTQAIVSKFEKYLEVIFG